ncbi:amidohydrolase [Sporolactobacillus spathodeae]|uniref:Amidohydrolase n=1 Tax=Sporolactobacillus spathodeae TaxID=1465502 RepID=A0ABS2QAF4_9BACL|nr:amidohydrolase [Sporolactobacillus spathodeae]
MMPHLSDENAFEKKLIDCRRKLHATPELAFEEYETTRLIKEQLSGAAVELLDFPLETGVLAVIRGKHPGPVLALRSDIDALPVQEATGLPFASKIPGRMHACGHDFHMTAILGAAQLLNSRKDQLAGTVKILFQPAEEIGRGAQRVLESGVLSDVAAIFSMHDMPSLPTGTIGINEGAMMAGVDRFMIDIEGIGSHAASPEKGSDVIVTASQIVTALQSIVSRNLSPLDSAVISITRIQSGNTWNVLPQNAQLEGTVRTFDEKVSSVIAERMEAVVTRVAAAFGVKAALNYMKIGPALRNVPQLATWSQESAERSGLTVVQPSPSFAGEDFAEYLKKIPGAFFFMGVSGTADLHHPDMTIDEKAILPSSHFFANLAEDMLKKITR